MSYHSALCVLIIFFFFILVLVIYFFWTLFLCLLFGSFLSFITGEVKNSTTKGFEFLFISTPPHSLLCATVFTVLGYGTYLFCVLFVSVSRKVGSPVIVAKRQKDTTHHTTQQGRRRFNPHPSCSRCLSAGATH